MSSSLSAAVRVRPVARTAYRINAVVAWVGVLLTAALSALGAYEDVPRPRGEYGDHPDGLAGVVSRLADTVSYFTIWSNVVVAVSLTLLALRPALATPARRLLRHDALLMISITAILYAVLLAPQDTIVGWSRLTNPILHTVTPLLTVVVWLVFGPRGWMTWRTALAAPLLPMAWIGWMLARGAVVGAYPYGFVNVVQYGYGPVLRTLALILVGGWVFGFVLWAIDVGLGRLRPGTPSPGA